MKAEKAAKTKADKKRRQYIERVAKNRIRNELKACGVLAQRQERERKKKVQELEIANSFVLFELREAIPDLEKDTTDTDIELQLQETLISTQQCKQYDALIAALDLALQDDFISFEGLMIWTKWRRIPCGMHYVIHLVNRRGMVKRGGITSQLIQMTQLTLVYSNLDYKQF